MAGMDEAQRSMMRQRLAVALGGPAQASGSPAQAFAANGGDFPDAGVLPVSDQPSAQPVPQLEPYRQSPFAAPGLPPMDTDPYKPQFSERNVSEEMSKLPGVVDTSKLNETPLWNGGGMTLDDVRRSHPPIAPLLEKWQREAVEAYTMMLRREGMSGGQARQKALKDLGSGAKIDGYALDPDAELFPEEWGTEPQFDKNGQPPFRTRNMDFKGMGEILRRALEVPWPNGPMPKDLQKELDDLLQDHQYDGQGGRMVPMSMMDGLDPVLRRIYRSRMGAAA